MLYGPQPPPPPPLPLTYPTVRVGLGLEVGVGVEVYMGGPLVEVGVGVLLLGVVVGVGVAPTSRISQKWAPWTLSLCKCSHTERSVPPLYLLHTPFNNFPSYLLLSIYFFEVF